MELIRINSLKKYKQLNQRGAVKVSMVLRSAHSRLNKILKIGI